MNYLKATPKQVQKELENYGIYSKNPEILLNIIKMEYNFSPCHKLEIVVTVGDALNGYGNMTIYHATLYRGTDCICAVKGYRLYEVLARMILRIYTAKSFGV